ncbi:hypothetical protein CANARDRAFT_29595 [[Candida] arabinofermentans NRRL YB-2248]|uniref:GAF domain-containing protein n=1 Tax=[Candida] arabinofermentans NRRL YB-2248 TaxID=983967 RepID=A0A1E4SWJ0_9ASCO|nr:hypothetical protein CANARDRAFT_29595 [[Candida] arabinofermentans NRRL YB-2248]
MNFGQSREQSSTHSATTVDASFQSESNNQQYQQQSLNEAIPMISMQNKSFAAVPLTKGMFLETYSKGKWNLSIVPRPPCFNDTVLLKPPEAYNEPRRLKAVEAYIGLSHWGNAARFNNLLMNTMKMFKCNGSSISLIDSRNQIVKYEHNLGFKQCDRNISIDAHALLSAGFLALLDASKDWRTEGNPLVRGTPTIKYYVAVPLLSPSKDVIGVFTIFDCNPRTKIEENTVSILQQISREIMQYFDDVYSSPTLLSSGKSPQHLSNKVCNSYKTSSDLFEEYGRATSTTNSSSVFEKDGSGNRYHQDGRIRFSKYSPPYGDLVDLNVWKVLLSCMNSKAACKILSKILKDKLGLSCVYIMHIRVSQSVKIKSELFPRENEIDSESYKFRQQLEPCGEENINLRLLGIEGRSEPSNLNAFHPGFHCKAFKSEFGILYSSKDPKVAYHSGICMPFFKKNPKLVRKKRISRIQAPSMEGMKSSSNRNDVIELYSRSGGYLITGFNFGARELSIEQVNYIYSCASILRRLYFMY